MVVVAMVVVAMVVVAMMMVAMVARRDCKVREINQ